MINTTKILKYGAYSLSAVMLFGMLAGCSSTKKSGGSWIPFMGKKHAKAAPRLDTARDILEQGVKAYQLYKYEEAEKAFKMVMEDYPITPEAVRAQLLIADLFYTQGSYEDAASYYTTFYTYHPAHPRAPYALFQKGMSNFKDVLSEDRDQTATRTALFAFQDLIRDYPDNSYTQKAREMVVFLKRRLAESELYVARFYFITEEYKGALLRYGEILSKYPNAKFVDEVLFYTAESYYELGNAKLAKEAYSVLVADFPKSKYVKDAKKRLENI
ncbi:hypothetical protein MNBD_DELTA01-884 [hydrothermal vent metagenome]|uniref:Outer membrane lipoprotein BamD-like domain-containing protein n=1 Tax=hydrothermal vent metagenome TaxID=652676 RepID=A0A3B0RCK1_9ZZZZ